MEFGTVAFIHHEGDRSSPTFGSSEPALRFIFFLCSIGEDVLGSLFWFVPASNRNTSKELVHDDDKEGARLSGEGA
jgi:hypothetical protein